MPKHCFVLWLAVLGKLKTKDRLPFIPPDTSCVLCNQDQESHGHLFFKCHWTSTLWGNIVRWLHIHRQMPTLSSTIRGLTPKKKRMKYKMRRASLGIAVYLIWEERNKRLFDNSLPRLRRFSGDFRSCSSQCFTSMKKITSPLMLVELLAGLMSLVGCCGLFFLSACMVFQLVALLRV